MIQIIKTGLVFVVIFGGTAYGYYFYHDVLAGLVVSLGVLAVPVLVLGIFFITIITSMLTGLPLFKKKLVKSDAVTTLRSPLDIKMLGLGLGVGLLICVPMVVVFVWLSRNLL